LPLAFYLKLFGPEISATEKMVNWILIVLCSALSIVGTIWSFLPKSLVGAE
jgi:vesicular inhibitory amino acid transporter